MPKRTGPRPRKNKQIFIDETDIDAHEDPNHEYEVEAILDKTYKEGKLHYFVKWKGYDETWNTWEPIDILKCPLVIKDFEKALKLKQLNPEKEVVPEKKKVQKRRQSNVSMESLFDASDDKNYVEAASVSVSNPVSHKSVMNTEAGSHLKWKMTSKKNKTSPVETDESNAKKANKDVKKSHEKTNSTNETNESDPPPFTVIRRQRSLPNITAKTDLLPSSSTVTSKTNSTVGSYKFSSSSKKTPTSKKVIIVELAKGSDTQDLYVCFLQDGKREKQIVSFDIFKDWYPKELLEYLQQFMCYKETPRATRT